MDLTMNFILYIIIEIMTSFLGFEIALLVFRKVKNSKENERKVYKRSVPKNIGRFADPLGEYDVFKDENNLYKTYVPKKTSRRGGIDNE